LLDAEVTLADHELPELEKNPKGSKKQKRRHAAHGNRERLGALGESARKSETRISKSETNWKFEIGMRGAGNASF
jgi:hypothetical protein